MKRPPAPYPAAVVVVRDAGDPDATKGPTRGAVVNALLVLERIVAQAKARERTAQQRELGNDLGCDDGPGYR